MTIQITDLENRSYREIIAELSERAYYTRPKSGRTIRKDSVYGYVGVGKSALIKPLKSAIKNLAHTNTGKEFSIRHVTVDANALTEFSQDGVDWVHNGNHHKTQPEWLKSLLAAHEDMSGAEDYLVVLHVDEYFAQQPICRQRWLNFEQGGRIGPHVLSDEQCQHTYILATGNGPGQGGASCDNALSNSTRGGSYNLVTTMDEVADYMASKQLLPIPLLAWIRSSSSPISTFQALQGVIKEDTSDSNYRHRRNAPVKSRKQIVNAFVPRSFEDGCITLMNIPGCLSNDGMSITDKGYNYLRSLWPSYVVDNVRTVAVQTESLIPWTTILENPMSADIPEGLLVQHIQASIMYQGISRQQDDDRYIPAMIIYLARKDFDSDVRASARFVLENAVWSRDLDEHMAIGSDVMALCNDFVVASMNSGIMMDTPEGVREINMDSVVAKAKALYATSATNNTSDTEIGDDILPDDTDTDADPSESDDFDELSLEELTEMNLDMVSTGGKEEPEEESEEDEELEDEDDFFDGL